MAALALGPLIANRQAGYHLQTVHKNGSGPGKVDLHGANALATLQDRSAASCLQHQSTSEEKHGGLPKSGSGDSFSAVSLKQLKAPQERHRETTGPFPTVSVNS